MGIITTLCLTSFILILFCSCSCRCHNEQVLCSKNRRRKFTKIPLHLPSGELSDSLSDSEIYPMKSMPKRWWYSVLISIYKCFVQIPTLFLYKCLSKYRIKEGKCYTCIRFFKYLCVTLLFAYSNIYNFHYLLVYMPIFLFLNNLQIFKYMSLIEDVSVCFCTVIASFAHTDFS